MVFWDWYNFWIRNQARDEYFMENWRISLHLTKFTVVIKEGVCIAAAVRELLHNVEAAPE